MLLRGKSQPEYLPHPAAAASSSVQSTTPAGLNSLQVSVHQLQSSTAATWAVLHQLLMVPCDDPAADQTDTGSALAELGPDALRRLLKPAMLYAQPDEDSL